MKKPETKTNKATVGKHTLIGWREWVSFPDLGVTQIKAKVDTGARTSALHVSKIHRDPGSRKIHFLIHPDQDSNKPEIEASAGILEYRQVKSSNGSVSRRPVIHTTLKVGENEHKIELTLVNRDMMGFRLLLGRQAIRKLFLVDPGRSYLTRKIKRKKK